MRVRFVVNLDKSSQYVIQYAKFVISDVFM